MDEQITQACTGQVENKVVYIQISHTKQRLQQLHEKHDAKADGQYLWVFPALLEHTRQKTTHREEHDQISDDIFDHDIHVDTVLL